MSQIEVYLDTAKTNILALEAQVGAPSVPGFPQTTNQAIVLVLKDLHESVNLLNEVVSGLAKRAHDRDRVEAKASD